MTTPHTVQPLQSPSLKSSWKGATFNNWLLSPFLPFSEMT